MRPIDPRRRYLTSSRPSLFLLCGVASGLGAGACGSMPAPNHADGGPDSRGTGNVPVPGQTEFSSAPMGGGQGGAGSYSRASAESAQSGSAGSISDNAAPKSALA